MSCTNDVVVVALGSSLAGPYKTSRALLEHCLGDFPKFGLHVQRQSSWWQSLAWPDPSQPPYLNGIVFVETVMPPTQVMASLLELERRYDRQRNLANAPRTLDLDLIAYGRATLNLETLTVPHPRAANRYFVMAPLAELAPAWIHPASGLTASTLAATAHIGRDAHVVGALAC